MCDMLGDTDVYVALTRRPEAPRNLTLARDGTQVRLRWEAPAAAREIAGYNAYRSQASGRGYQRVNRERIPGCEFVDTPPPGPVFYAVAAEEHSGLEGFYSEEAPVAGLAGESCYRVYVDPEEGQLSPPLRQHFDGRCSNFRCVRVWKEAPAEVVGQATHKLRIPAPGQYYLWMRGRGEGQFECSSCNQRVGGRIDSADWAWTPVGPPLTLPDGTQQIVLRSSDDGLSLDLVMLTSESTDRPERLDDRDPVPAPVDGLRATEVSPGQVRLVWTPSAAADLDGYSVHVGADADFVPGNASLLASGRGTEYIDWGFKPGATLYYKVLACNKRGAESAPTTVGVEAPQMATASVELDIADATLSGGLVKACRQDAIRLVGRSLRRLDPPRRPPLALDRV